MIEAVGPSPPPAQGFTKNNNMIPAFVPIVWQLGHPAACWGGWSACIQSECSLFSDLRKPRLFLLLAATAHSSCRMLSGSCAPIHAFMLFLLHLIWSFPCLILFHRASKYSIGLLQAWPGGSGLPRFTGGMNHFFTLLVSEIQR